MIALAARLSELDEAVGGDPRSLLQAFVRQWQHVTDTGSPPGLGGGAELVDAADAELVDRMVEGSRALRALRDVAPTIIQGPLDLGRQCWIATSRVGQASAPDRARFLEAITGGRREATAKPAGFGLYTCTGVFGGPGMWQVYLAQNRGSSLFPLPWHAWAARIEPGARVRTITGARDWLDLVANHPVDRADARLPNWSSIANTYDGIHLTLTGIAATQGLWFRAGSRAIPGPYWDVESTVWLRWVFTGFRPDASTRDGRDWHLTIGTTHQQ